MPAVLAEALIQQPPAWKRLLKPLYRRLLLTRPASVFMLAGVRSHLAYDRFPDTPSPDEVGAFWKDFSRSRCLEVARLIRTIEFRNRELRDFVRHCGVERLAPLVRCRGAGRLVDLHARKLPAILAGWHFRTHFFVVLTALHRLRIPALLIGFRFSSNRLPPGIELLSPPKSDCMRRALVVKRALEYLRAGGFVCICIDHPLGNGILQVPFMGRRLNLRRGVATLARLSGAPVIPISQKWDALGRAITVTIHDPLPRPACPAAAGIAFEEAILGEVARWVERYARALPEELCLDLLALSLERCQGPGPNTEGGPVKG